MLASTINNKLVPVDGLEPSHPKAGDFESSEQFNGINSLSCFFLIKSLFLAFKYQPLKGELLSILGSRSDLKPCWFSRTSAGNSALYKSISYIARLSQITSKTPSKPLILNQVCAKGVTVVFGGCL